MKTSRILLLIILVVGISWYIVDGHSVPEIAQQVIAPNQIEKIEEPFKDLKYSRKQKQFLQELVDSANNRLDSTVEYDPAYFGIDYPNGDVPENKGVCSDVVIRSFRGVGIDLQQLVHEDIKENFDVYPKKWGLTKPDTNIDHRRVPNLITFFTRYGEVLRITGNPADYYPGDVITWDFPDGRTHTGMVVDSRRTKTGNPMIVHNIGRGPQLHDVLFEWEITGHFRYFGENKK